MAPTEDEMRRDWTSLPFDIVISITERLPLPDYFRFCSVCPSWSSLSAENFPIPSHSPSLLLCHRSSNFSILTFPEQQRSYRLPKLPEHINYLGYHDDGWLVIAHGSGQEVDSYVLNPITRIQVPLPSFKSLCRGLPYCRIGKIVISDSPSSCDGDFFAAALFGSFNSHLAYCKPGDEAWTLLETSYNSDHSIDDIVFYDDKLFVLSSRGQLEIFDLSLSSCSMQVVVSNLDIGTPVVPAWIMEFRDDVYLVRSCFGDLLQVRGRRDHRSGEMLRFDVYKFSRLDSRWVETKDLGGQSLFVSNKHSACLLLPSSLGRLRKNCVYFAEFESWNCESGTDVRIFDVEKGLILPFAAVGSLVDRVPLHSLFWPIGRITITCWPQGIPNIILTT